MGTAVTPDRDPGALRAALMTMSAVAWAARWAASGRTLVQVSAVVTMLEWPSICLGIAARREREETAMLPGDLIGW